MELIDRETVRKNAYLPVKIAELSHKDPEAALQLLRDWGEGRKPVLHLWDEVVEKLETVKDLAEVV